VSRLEELQKERHILFDRYLLGNSADRKRLRAAVLELGPKSLGWLISRLGRYSADVKEELLPSTANLEPTSRAADEEAPHSERVTHMVHLVPAAKSKLEQPMMAASDILCGLLLTNHQVAVDIVSVFDQAKQAFHGVPNVGWTMALMIYHAATPLQRNAINLIRHGAHLAGPAGDDRSAAQATFALLSSIVHARAGHLDAQRLVATVAAQCGTTPRQLEQATIEKAYAELVLVA
jgi:hypothetical protein